MEIAEECEVEWSGGPQFYVKCPTGEYVVDLSSKTCACRRWDLTGIPCGHGVAVILDRGDNPTKYVHKCYTVQTYLQCYENIVNPINGKKLWPKVNALPLQPSGWVVAKKGMKQKKRRRQQEEDVISRSGSTSRMKKKGIVKMTCGVCGLTGHNKRYHDKADAPIEDWGGNDLTHINEDRSSQVESQISRAKLVPQRANENSRSEVQQNPPTDGYIFMPTPGLGVTSDAQSNQSNNNGPLPTTIRQTENIPLSNMVGDFLAFEAQENARKMVDRVKQARVVRGSVPFAHPRARKSGATQ